MVRVTDRGCGLDSQLFQLKFVMTLGNDTFASVTILYIDIL